MAASVIFLARGKPKKESNQRDLRRPCAGDLPATQESDREGATYAKEDAKKAK